MSNSRAKPQNKNSHVTKEDESPRVRTRSVRIGSPKDENSIFTELYAQVYPADPKGSNKSTHSLKLKLTHNSSLPASKKHRHSEEAVPTDLNREYRRKNMKDQVLVDYTDDEDNDSNDDGDFLDSCSSSTTNKFAQKKPQQGNYRSFKLLDTKPPDNLTPTKDTKAMNPLTFYNKTKSPKTYRRIGRDVAQPNGRFIPLSILKVPSKIPSEPPVRITQSKLPPFNSSSGEPSPRRALHRECNTTVKIKKNTENLETIDLIDYEEIKQSAVMEIDFFNNSDASPSAPPANFEPDPEFLLSYDDDTDPPPISFGEYMEATDEVTEQLRMKIKLIYFGSLRCKPLDLLEVDKESFKLHIQILGSENTFEQLLHIQARNIEFAEIHKLKHLGYIRIKPKRDTFEQLSNNLNLAPTLYLNYNDSQDIKNFVAIVFDNRNYLLGDVHNSLKRLFDFPVCLIENDNSRFLMYDNSISQVETTLKVETKSSPKPDSSKEEPNIILSSSDSPVYTEAVIAGREKEHSYCESKRGSRKPPEVIQEFNQLIESDTDKLLTYPGAGHSRRITIYKDTVSCLQPELFLNDTIIEFYLLYIYHGILTQTQRDQVHIFNTFFYTKLTNNLNSLLTAQNMEEKHSLVSKWTKNVDLFEKDFILIPIHDHAHWLLAIICYPSLAGREAVLAPEDDTIDLELTGSTRCLRRKKTVEKLACILIFDSLAIKRNDVITNLRLYLQAEWNARYKSRGQYTCSSSNKLVGHHPILPIQPNSSDCGLFVMQYAESFFTKSLHDFAFPVKLEDWFSLDEIKHKRNLVIKLIFDLSKNENYKQM